MADDRINEAFVYNPHIWWDPIGPIFSRELDQASQKQLAHIRLSLFKDVLTAQMKAVDGAIGLLSQAKR